MSTRSGGRAAARAARHPGAETTAGARRRLWALRLMRNVLLWLVPAALAWALSTPFYNRFLEVAGQNAAHLIESPDVTRLYPKDSDFALIARLDFPREHEIVSSLRVTDIHFPVILLLALFLGVPGVGWRERLANLGWALLVSACFDVVLVLFWIEFTYATQLGSWSLEHYGAFARNFWGLGKHVLDLPIKLGLPLLLWAWFYLGRLLPAPEVEAVG